MPIGPAFPTGKMPIGPAFPTGKMPIGPVPSPNDGHFFPTQVSTVVFNQAVKRNEERFLKTSDFS